MNISSYIPSISSMHPSARTISLSHGYAEYASLLRDIPVKFMFLTAITNNTTFLQDIGAPSTATTDTLTNKTQHLNTSGNISSSMTVGSSKVTFDPANERILIAD